MPETDEEREQYRMARVTANDPAALFKMGNICFDEGDFEGTLKYFTMAAKLGEAEAHFISIYQSCIIRD